MIAGHKAIRVEPKESWSQVLSFKKLSFNDVYVLPTLVPPALAVEMWPDLWTWVIFLTTFYILYTLLNVIYEWGMHSKGEHFYND